MRLAFILVFLSLGIFAYNKIKILYLFIRELKLKAKLYIAYFVCVKYNSI